MKTIYGMFGHRDSGITFFTMSWSDLHNLVEYRAILEKVCDVYELQKAWNSVSHYAFGMNNSICESEIQDMIRGLNSTNKEHTIDHKEHFNYVALDIKQINLEYPKMLDKVYGNGVPLTKHFRNGTKDIQNVIKKHTLKMKLV